MRRINGNVGYAPFPNEPVRGVKGMTIPLRGEGAEPLEGGSWGFAPLKPTHFCFLKLAFCDVFGQKHAVKLKHSFT